jgi:hypothetical protein
MVMTPAAGRLRMSRPQHVIDDGSFSAGISSLPRAVDYVRQVRRSLSNAEAALAAEQGNPCAHFHRYHKRNLAQRQGIGEPRQ